MFFLHIISLFAFFYICFYVTRTVLGIIIGNLNEIIEINCSNKRNKKKKKTLINGISVIIPCHNEEKLIKKCIVSVYKNHIPGREVIVVNDGSTDDTSIILKNLKRIYTDLIIVEQENTGKGSALNNAIFNYVTKDLVMVLDADSTINKYALRNSISYFSLNPKVIASSICIYIDKFQKPLEILQYFEYLVGARLKLSDKALNNIFVIGGVGSSFRTKYLKEVGGYGNDSITEDLDLSMKLIHHYGNTKYLISHNFDAIAYTPPTHNLRDLLVQRYRWKYGLVQGLIKYKDLFFSINFKKYSLGLTWWRLPILIFADELGALILPPFMVYVMYNYIVNHHISTSFLISSISLSLFLLICVLLLVRSVPIMRIIIFIFISPIIAIFMYIMVLVDTFTIILCLFKIKEIIQKKNLTSKWTHVKR